MTRWKVAINLLTCHSFAVSAACHLTAWTAHEMRHIRRYRTRHSSAVSFHHHRLISPSAEWLKVIEVGLTVDVFVPQRICTEWGRTSHDFVPVVIGGVKANRGPFWLDAFSWHSLYRLGKKQYIGRCVVAPSARLGHRKPYLQWIMYSTVTKSGLTK